MTRLSFKSAVFSLVIVCFLSGSAVADTFTFTGDAFENADSMDFNLTGPSFTIHSGFVNGPTVITQCTTGTLCTIPPQNIPANSFQPGFSGGTVDGVTADVLVGELTFSSFSFTSGPDNGGTGSVTVTGDLTGHATNDLGPEVFDLQIIGSGTGTASGIPAGPIFGVEYTFSGTATTAPEPSSLLWLSSALIGLAIRRRHLLRK